MVSARPSDRIGPWVVLRRIAIGGMAEIFEVRDAAAAPGAPTVVLKVLLPQHARDPEFVRMLADEARVHTVLEHPNLVRVLAHGVSGEQPWLALERVDGPSLAELTESLKRQGRELAPAVALFIGAELLRALEYVHAATDADGRALAIVHRDVTPQNVLLDRAGRVRLGDFGIARSTVRDGRTRTGVIKGKLQYLAPEQVTLSTVDARTDLYSAGVLVWELLAGEPYVRGETEIELLRAAESPVFRKLARKGADPRLDVILERALARFPEERWSSARAFLDALEGVRSDAALRADAEDLAKLVEERNREEDTRPGGRGGRGSGPKPDAQPAETAPSSESAETVSQPRLSIVGPLAILSVAALGVGIAWQLGAFAPTAETPIDTPALLTRDAGTAIDAAAGAQAAPPDAAAELDAGAAPEPIHDGGAPRDRDASLARRRDAGARRDAGLGSTPEVRPDAGVPSVSGAHAALVTRGAALRADLRARGILSEDLSAGLRAELRALEEALDASHDGDAERLLASLETALPAVAVDAAFVRAKLDRVTAAMRAARAAGRDVSRLEDLSATALQEYLDGRYESTNRRLNEILRQLH